MGAASSHTDEALATAPPLPEPLAAATELAQHIAILRRRAACWSGSAAGGSSHDANRGASSGICFAGTSQGVYSSRGSCGADAATAAVARAHAPPQSEAPLLRRASTVPLKLAVDQAIEQQPPESAGDELRRRGSAPPHEAALAAAAVAHAAATAIGDVEVRRRQDSAGAASTASGAASLEESSEGSTSQGPRGRERALPAPMQRSSSEPFDPPTAARR